MSNFKKLSIEEMRNINGGDIPYFHDEAFEAGKRFGKSVAGAFALICTVAFFL